jgi:hypothetical protein
VDFSSKNSNNNPVCDGMRFDGDSQGTPGVEYDAAIGYFVTKTSSGQTLSGWNHFYNDAVNGINPATGDFYCLMEDIGTFPPSMFWFDNDDFGTDYKEANARYLPGSFRMFMPSGVYNPNNRARFNQYHISDGGKCKLIFGGFTLPANAILYKNGVGDTYYPTSGNAITYDTAAACCNVTTKACQQLKTACGDNVRIYVVKYRSQGSAGDYDYLDACATAGRVYSAGDEAELAARLQEIANDIRAWAGYAPARNVD